MGAVRILLPVPRTLARAHVGLGGPLLGAALLRCLTPGLFLIRQRPPERLLAWSEEAVAVYRTLHEGPRRRSGDGLALALVLYANALYVAGRYEEALAASDESRAVVGTRMSPTRSAYALRVRTLLLTETEQARRGSDRGPTVRCRLPGHRTPRQREVTGQPRRRAAHPGLGAGPHGPRPRVREPLYGMRGVAARDAHVAGSPARRAGEGPHAVRGDRWTARAGPVRGGRLNAATTPCGGPPA